MQYLPHKFYTMKFSSVTIIAIKITRYNHMFTTQFTVSIREINYGNHLDHAWLIGYLHEARVQYIRSNGYNEGNIDGIGSHLVVVELNCKYKKEAFYGDKLTVRVHTIKKSDLRLIFVYIVTRDKDIIATAEITVAFININNKPIKIPRYLKN